MEGNMWYVCKGNMSDQFGIQMFSEGKMYFFEQRDSNIQTATDAGFGIEFDQTDKILLALFRPATEEEIELHLNTEQP